MADIGTKVKLTMVVIHDEKTGYLSGYFEEFPEVLGQGEDVEELKARLLAGLGMYFRHKQMSRPSGRVRHRAIKERWEYVLDIGPENLQPA